MDFIQNRQNINLHTMVFPSPRRYHAFLLRFWREDEKTPWRIQIENPLTHEVIGFRNMESLLRFLGEQVPDPIGGMSNY